MKSQEHQNNEMFSVIRFVFEQKSGARIQLKMWSKMARYIIDV
jgi:hypothetical protein